jgi:uncharacterized protein YndB with AHSA1/START domain
MGTLPKHGEVSIEVAASPEQVWALVSDLTRAGEWSHEAEGGEWLGDATDAVPGARFRGSNRSGRWTWSRECEVLEVEPGRRISWRTIPSLRYRDSSRWSYELEPTATGCRITQRYDVIMINPIMDRVFYALLPAHRDRSAALAEDVRRLGERAAALTAA